MNTEQELRPLEWPERLKLRDTKVYADEGQRIFTTATGYGYEKCEYVRADIADASRSSDEQAEVVAWQVTQYDPNGRLYDSVSLVRGSLPDYYRTERWGSSGHAMWEVIPLYRSPAAVAVGGVTEERLEAGAKALCLATGLDWDSIPETAEGDDKDTGPETRRYFRQWFKPALTDALAVGDEGIREGAK